MINKFCHTLFLLSFPFLLLAQNNTTIQKENSKSDKKKTHEVQRAINIGDNFMNLYNKVDSALIYYSIANEISPNNNILNFKIAKSYLIKQKLHLADSFITEAYQLKKNLDIIYLRGRINHLAYSPQKAIKYYKEYINEHDKFNIPDTAYVQKLILQAQNFLVSDSLALSIKNIDSLNTPFNEYSPLLIPNTNQLFFTSDRYSLINLNYTSDNIYYSHYNDTSFSEGKIINNRHINIKGNSAISSISKSGKTMIMYHGFDVGRIFYSKLDLTKDPILPNKKNKLPSPISSYFTEVIGGTFTPDGKAFYFSSKRKNGKGKFDIYYTFREGKKWATPILVENINTNYNEIDPYFSTNGDTLFFASDSPNGIGGYDIYKSIKGKNQKWSEPKGLPLPINTPFDEKTPSSNTDGSVLYFSSNRPKGKGGYDIYKTREKPIINHESLISQQKITLDSIFNEKLINTTVYLFNKKDSSIIKNANITIYTLPGNKVLRKSQSDSNGKSYFYGLPTQHLMGINILTKGYELFSKKVFIETPDSLYNIYLMPIELNQKVTLNNVFFNHNSSKITSSSLEELRNLISFLNVNPAISIQLGGHTDNSGDDDINIILSQKRAAAIVDFLTDNGIKKDRLESKGYGSSKPIATNNTKEGKALNRRTEFKIIKN